MLNMRPNSIFSIPIQGDYVSTPKLLLRIRRRKPKTQAATAEAEAAKFDAAVVGRIKHTCRFRALSDFQYTVDPQHPMVKLCQSLDSGDVTAIREFKFDFASQMDPARLSIPPPLFSRIELCDVTDRDIRRLLDAEQGILPVCNERDGWYRPEVLAGVRKLCRLKRQAATNNTSASQEEVEAIIAETFSLLEREYTPPDASQASEAAANEKNAASMARADEPAHEMDVKMNMLLQNLSQALASDAPETSSSITTTATVASRTLAHHHPQDYSGLFSDVDEFEGIFGDSLDEEDEDEEEEEEEED
ncbi:hypothetical protein SYNPS1DRAFT_23239 [Syncephalis pseudoplumigaleata]|uniref:Transcription factor IIIC subunit Tfc1/Sfc1 triple barrel domain-containing protein n=1 Tax=Syncephalis pseudoplumigaleata TaxID=1712513 RepID=A0A4P9Z049_9FUNG|nr:hypothetical protein SYNPS1DRAFT_23239 [Syncephalis pseudoplumigaleata]|eukprot:RKP24700.1 hypothetical protein SYNPS1DRAFT_23239 [Syncephalis pseudoplumigaleata]